MKTILVVDDEPKIVQLARDYLEQAGFTVTTAHDGAAALATARAALRGPRQVRSLARAFNAMAERLEASGKARQSLLADVTHELPNPLAVIQGSLEAIVDGVHPADAEHVKPVLDETRVLGRLIDDLRTLAQAEAGALPLHPEPTDLAALVSGAMAAFRAQSEQAGVALELAADTGLRAANIDPLRTREVVANLVANAIRYTPRGGRVLVEVRTLGDRVALVVTDNGKGILAEDAAHIFERFYKSADSPGAGLGLAIAKSIVEAQGGDILLDGAPGTGARIRVTLPLA